MCGHKATIVHVARTFFVHTLIEFSDTGVKKNQATFRASVWNTQILMF